MKPLISGRITITRSQSIDDTKIHITIEDTSSRTQFFDGYMELADFAAAITGLGSRPIEFTPRGLDRIGKNVEMKELVFKVPKYRDKEFAKKNAQKFADKGWTADLYFDSQDSFSHTAKGESFAHTVQRRYVEKPQDGNDGS